MTKQKLAARSPFRTALFVDTVSLWFWAKRWGEGRDLDRARLDYSRLRHFVANNRDVVFANAYIWQHDKSDSFARALSHLSYNVRSVPYRDPAHELIAADLVDSSDNWDVAVLVTGEGEYGRFFRELRAQGKWIEVHSVDLDCPIQRIKLDVDKHAALPMEQLTGAGDKNARRVQVR